MEKMQAKMKTISELRWREERKRKCGHSFPCWEHVPAGSPSISLQGEYVSCMIVLCLRHASCRCPGVDIRALGGLCPVLWGAENDIFPFKALSFVEVDAVRWSLAWPLSLRGHSEKQGIMPRLRAAGVTAVSTVRSTPSWLPPPCSLQVLLCCCGQERSLSSPLRFAT